jgi:hypothetical protein
LPNVDKRTVEGEKIQDCLLNPEYRFAASKARFFERFGFTLDNWGLLAKASQEQGQAHEVRRLRETGFGPRFEV